MAFTHVIPADGVRGFRHDMLEQLAEARKQVHDARSHDDLDVGRSHLSFVCDMLDALGWDEREPETDVPLEPVRNALRRHIERERPRLESHDTERREGTRIYIKMCENLLAAIEPDEPSFVAPAAAHADIRVSEK